MKDGVKSIIHEHLVMEFCKKFTSSIPCFRNLTFEKTTNLHEGFGIPLGVK
jgi:hypothetical protein